MQAIAFFLIYPIMFLVAKLPYALMYKLSDFLYFVLILSGYRQKVIEKNIRNAFPNKSEIEIKKDIENYNRYLCDLVLETLKTLVSTEQEALQRCKVHIPHWLQKYSEEKKSIIILMGHYGNWEWANPGFSLKKIYQLNVIYKPLSNPYFEKMLVGTRTKFNTQITKMNDTLREMMKAKDQPVAYAFVADQTPFPENAYWMQFLNQETAVYTGFEKLARKFNYPVVYARIKRIKRGYYEIFPELLFDSPKETKENEICHTFMKLLEQDIIKDPSIWLWSHKRWKHTRKH
jgi:KDO2-lipid IV(A) lauroyltransferase